MKKALVIFAVLALTMAMASVAMAEVTVDGSVEFLMRSIKNVNDWNDKITSTGDWRSTQERIRIGINAKHEGVKGRVQIENDWDYWGRVEAPQGNSSIPVVATSATTTAANDAGRLKIREGWIDFNMPWGIPGHIKVGHQFLQLGNGWFFRSNKYGSDAWVIGFPGQNTVAFVNIKAYEGATSRSDDVDAYVLLDVFKLDEKNTVGAYYARVHGRGSVSGEELNLDTIGLHYNGVVGPIKLAAEVDFQMGDNKDLYGGGKEKFSGNQIVLQGTMPMDALTLNATLARGSGDDGTDPSKNKAMQVLMDKDPHYTLVYEYFMKTAAGATQTSFSNTAAVGVGADFQVNPMILVGANFWFLQADKKFAAQTGGTPDKAIGNEIDVKFFLKLADQLTWNTGFGYFMPGKAYEDASGKADAATAIQSVLSYKF